jgi:hypothetical protein
MDTKPDRPLRLFVNPVAIWTDLALKTGQVLLASAQAAVQSRARVAVIPPADAPAPVAPEVKAAEQPPAAPKVARAKAAKSARATPRSRKAGKRRGRR